MPATIKRGYMSQRSIVTVILLLLLLLGIGEGAQNVLVKSADNCSGQIVTKIGEDYIPSIGKAYLVVDTEITNNGYDALFPVSPSYFAVIVDGNLYYNSYATYGLDTALRLPHLTDTELGNGNSISGYIAFEVPQGSSKEYKLEYVGKSGWNVLVNKC